MSGPLWVTWLLNVLLTSGTSVYALAQVALMLEAEFWAHAVIKMMWCDFLRDNKQQLPVMFVAIQLIV